MSSESNTLGNDRYGTWLKNVGRQIAKRRTLLGLTQVQAAEKCGLDLKFYQDLEYGRRAISTRTLFRLAETLDVDVTGLIPSSKNL